MSRRMLEDSPVIQMASIQDAIPSFLEAYRVAQPEEKQNVINQLKQQHCLINITPYQFGQCVAELTEIHLTELYEHILRTKPIFLQNSTEFTHVCAALPVEKISLFCNCMTSVLKKSGFIDNAKTFSAIFAPFLFLPEGKKPGLNMEQLHALFNSLKPIISAPLFLKKLRDFIDLFLQSPNINCKAYLFDMFKTEIAGLIQKENNIGEVDQLLTTLNTEEKPLFKTIRNHIFRAFAYTRQLPQAVYAILFLIQDNYPGEQKDKLNNIIKTLLSTSFSSEHKQNEIIQQFQALKDQENITSTRLNRALSQLLSDIENNNPIDIEFIIAVSQNKHAYRIFQEWPNKEATRQLDPATREEMTIL